MKKYRIGIVGLASHFESGDQRAAEILGGIRRHAENAGLQATMASMVVYEPADALSVCEEFRTADIDAIVIADITWVMDSLKYIFINEIQAPVVFWAVPYVETFSIACVQHFCSIMKSHGLVYSYVYGLPNAELIKKIRVSAVAGSVIKQIAKARIALVGPRQTWRVAGPQDMTDEEWDFSKQFGATLIHLEMDTLLTRITNIKDKDAEAALTLLMPKTAAADLDRNAFRFFAKVYLAVRDIIAENHLTALAAECYPQFSGLLNLASSWLADESIIIDTEGDIGHTLLSTILNACAGEGATILGEAGCIQNDENYLMIAHEGSTAYSYAGDLSSAQIISTGAESCFIGFSVRPMDCVTVSSMVCSRGKYRMLITTAETIPVSHAEWVDAGSKMLAKLRFNQAPAELIDRMIQEGFDHHFVIKEGDYTQELSLICDYLNIDKVIL